MRLRQFYGPQAQDLTLIQARINSLTATRAALKASCRHHREALAHSQTAAAETLDRCQRHLAELDQQRQQQQRLVIRQRGPMKAAQQRLTRPLARLRQLTGRLFGGPSWARMHNQHAQLRQEMEDASKQLRQLEQKIADITEERDQAQAPITRHEQALQSLQDSDAALAQECAACDQDLDRTLEAMALHCPLALWPARLQGLTQPIDQTRLLEAVLSIQRHQAWLAGLPQAPDPGQAPPDLATTIHYDHIRTEHALLGRIQVTGRGHHHWYEGGNPGGWKKYAITYGDRLRTRLPYHNDRWQAKTTPAALTSLLCHHYCTGYQNYCDTLQDQTTRLATARRQALDWLRNVALTPET